GGAAAPTRRLPDPARGARRSRRDGAALVARAQVGILVALTAASAAGQRKWLSGDLRVLRGVALLQVAQQVRRPDEDDRAEEQVEDGDRQKRRRAHPQPQRDRR